jgi:methionine sulfoxide reductase heme-binding subunit
MARLRRNWLRWLAHLGALVPLALLLWDAAHNDLTVNPIQEITFRTGKTALVLLVLTLACTPLNTLFGLKQLLPLRRPLGLYAFFYAALHLSIFAVLDYGLDWGLIRDAIVEKRFVLVGFTAFVLLAPLALTSTKGWMRRLGKRWKQLHRLIYVAALLVIVHYVWLVKADVREPLAYGAVVAALLLLRLPPVRRAVSRLRYRVRGNRGQGTGNRGSAASPSRHATRNT